MNETIRSILDRRSTRGFADSAISAEQLELLKQCAVASPTGMNKQSWHFSFVQSRELIAKVERSVGTAILASDNDAVKERLRSREMKVFYNAPLVVFISSDPNNKWHSVDAGIAAENLALAAHSMGLGSVIIAMCDVAFAGEAGERLGKFVAFPDGNVFSIAVAIGRPIVSKEAHPVQEGKISMIG